MRTTTSFTALDRIPESLRGFALRRGAEAAGLGLIAATAGLGLALASWSVQDPSFNHAASGPVHNLLGAPGAAAADLVMQMLGLSVIAFLTPVSFWGWRLIAARRLERVKARLVLWLGGGVLWAGLASLLPVTARWPLPTGLGGVVGDAILAIPSRMLAGHLPGMLL
ncbi:MAG: DNA translocase FtsK 4TM domain-containing protein, partial [Methylocella sp.]